MTSLENYLTERKVTEDYHILYHSTDSDFFDTVRYDKAKKGERYFNPLGNGLYCSTNKEFSRTFGKNTYYYLLPKSSKVKIITKSSWTSSNYQSILNKVLRNYGLKYWKDLSLGQKVELMRLSKHEPITSLYELHELLSAPDLGFGLSDVQETIEKVVDGFNSSYDAIWYKDTNYYQKADEVVIPLKSFRKELFFKELPTN